MSSNRIGTSSPSPAKAPAFEAPVAIRYTRLLGKGSHAHVYEGTMKKTGMTVAIKILAYGSDEALAAKQKAANKKETAIMRSLKHPNLMPLIDAYDDPTNFTDNLIMRMIKKWNWLHDEKIKIADRKEIVLGITQGVEYMHEKGVLHRDLKAENVLLELIGEKLNPLILDFGLSVRLNVDYMGGKPVGSPLYCAPEIIEATQKNVGFSQYSQFTDTYSLGLTIWEIFAKNLPNDECVTIQELFSKVCVRKELPQAPEQDQWPPSVKMAMTHCLMFDATKRCTATRIKEYLTESNNEAAGNLKL